MSRSIRKKTRSTKIIQEEFSEHSINTKEKYAGSLGHKNIHLTESQRELYNTIDNNTITFVYGPAGSGKTTAGLMYAVKNYLLNPTDDIIVIRTPVEACDDKVGYLPSTLQMKLEPHFQSAKTILETLLNKGKVESDMDKRIHFKIPNYALGCTFSNSIVLLDEAQMLSPLTIKLLLERTGLNTKVIVCGDPTQIYDTNHTRNGLTDAVNRFFKTENNKLVLDENNKPIPLYENIGFHQFEIKDVVRSDIVKTVLQAYSNVSS